jgi:predicted PhzF superfamily epimerase YddE/YHI9
MLGSRDELLALRPDFANLTPRDIGAVAPCPAGHAAQFELRAFIGGSGPNEDPVTGSLNAGVAQWLIGAGLAPERYTAMQGTALARDGRVYVERRGADIWIGGDCSPLVEGRVDL